MREHANAFDLIRLIAASLVLWSHQLALMGLPESGVTPFHVSFGGFGVLMFFVVSGYLNTHSVLRHRSMRDFLVSRGLRIYPALMVCVAITVLLGACAAPDLKNYLDYTLLSFIGKDITLFTGVKAGVSHAVFASSTLPNALNGSLWTLPYEVKMYVILAISFVAMRYSPAAALLVSACALAALSFSALDSSYWLGFGAAFLAGAFTASVQKLKGLGLAIAALMASASMFAVFGREFFALYLLLGAAVIACGCARLPSRLRPPLDLSYAAYLYAFPVQQVSVSLTKNFWLGLSFSVVVTFVLALLSALLVERPAQKLKLALQQRSNRAAEALTATIRGAASTQAEAV